MRSQDCDLIPPPLQTRDPIRTPFESATSLGHPVDGGDPKAQDPQETSSILPNWLARKFSATVAFSPILRAV